MVDFDASSFDEVERILTSDLPDLDKMTQAYDCITAFVIGHAQAEIEQARALQDPVQVLKTQIKRDTMAYARSIFEHCNRRVTGGRPAHQTA